jgi:hypothetical protein
MGRASLAAATGQPVAIRLEAWRPSQRGLVSVLLAELVAA